MHASFSTKQQENDRQRARGCCKAFPWVPVACLVLLVVGTPLWVLNAYAAAGTTSSALSAATVDLTTIQEALGTMGTIRLVVLAILIITAVFVLVLSALQAVRKRSGAGGGRPAMRALLAADGFAALLLWVLLFGAMVLLALTATWFLGSMAVDTLLNTATQYSSTAEKAASRAVDSAQVLIEQLKTTQLAALDNAPQEVKDSQWFKDFRNGVNNFNQTFATAASTPAAASCAPGCISLDFLAGLAGLNSTCICLTNTITNVQHGLQATKQATMYSLVGLLLVYLGTSWLLMHFASEFTSTKQDLSERKRMAKSSSTGEALYNPGRVSPSADAAIDIRGDDSPIGYKGPSTAMARGAHLEYPFVQNVVADGRASAQRGGGAGGTRLPYV